MFTSRGKLKPCQMCKGHKTSTQDEHIIQQKQKPA